MFNLPQPLYHFFRNHIQYIESHAVDPDKRRYAVIGEAENHYIDIDRYTHSPDSVFSIFPMRWDSAVVKFSEDTLRAHGIAPWNTYFVYAKLRKAFELKDEKKILRHSVDLAHYVGDIHVPLHTTSNYNGQLTNQLGIHGFWETRVPELFWDSYHLKRRDAVYLNTPLLTIWEVVENTHRKVDSVLDLESQLNEQLSEEKYSIETRGVQEVRTYSERYTAAYSERLNGMVERQLQSAVNVLSDLWLSAWIEAGQPDLSESALSLETTKDSVLIDANKPAFITRSHE